MDWLDPAFCNALVDPTGRALQALLVEECSGVYSFPLLTPEFCDKLSFEVANYEASPYPRFAQFSTLTILPM
jgi:hypothetical protein